MLKLLTFAMTAALLAGCHAASSPVLPQTYHMTAADTATSNTDFAVATATTKYYDALGDSVTGCTHSVSGTLTHPTVCPVAGAGNVTMYPQLVVNAWKAAGATYLLQDLAVSGEGLQTYTSCFITVNAKPLVDVGFNAPVPPYPQGANQLTELNRLHPDSIVTVSIGFDELAVRAADSIEGCSKQTASQIASTMFSELSASFQTIRKAEPQALIVIGNEANGQKLPNASGKAFTGNGHTIYLSDSRMNAYFSAWIKKIDTFSALNAFVADTACQAFVYNKSYHGTDIHFNQAGQQLIANYLLSQIKSHTPPNPNCTYAL